MISSGLISDSPRWRFTLAHEIGHLLLHANILSNRYSNGIDTETSFTYMITNNLFKRVEIQANYFASCILLPELPLTVLVKQIFVQNGILNGRLLLGYKEKSHHIYNLLIKHIRNYFNVSEMTAKYRLLELQLIYERNSYMSVRQILDTM